MIIFQYYNLSMLTYEAGQHIVISSNLGGGPDDEIITNKFIEMNRSPRMEQVKTEWLDMYESTVVQVWPYNRALLPYVILKWDCVLWHFKFLQYNLHENTVVQVKTFMRAQLYKLNLYERVN